MQHPNGEVVLRLDANVRHDGPLNFEQAARFLMNAIQMSNTTPYYYAYIDKPAPGDMHAIFQIGSLPTFTVDGLRYLEQEQVFTIALGQFELEVSETKYGFVPGVGEQMASRMRRKIRFVKGQSPTVVLVHYWQIPGLPVPPQLANQPVRKYPLIPPNEPGIFVMGEKVGQKVFPPGHPGHQAQAVNGQGPYPNAQQQIGVGGQIPPQLVRPPGQQVPAAHAIAAQNAAMNAHRGPAPKPLLSDENEEDDSDIVTFRDIASTRFIRNHEFLAELFSPEPLPKTTEEEPSAEEVKELEANLAKLAEELAALESKTTELETVKLTGETAQLAVQP